MPLLDKSRGSADPAVALSPLLWLVTWAPRRFVRVMLRISRLEVRPTWTGSLKVVASNLELQFAFRPRQALANAMRQDPQRACMHQGYWSWYFVVSARHKFNLSLWMTGEVWNFRRVLIQGLMEWNNANNSMLRKNTPSLWSNYGNRKDRSQLYEILHLIFRAQWPVTVAPFASLLGSILGQPVGIDGWSGLSELADHQDDGVWRKYKLKANLLFSSYISQRQMVLDWWNGNQVHWLWKECCICGSHSSSSQDFEHGQCPHQREKFRWARAGKEVERPFSFFYGSGLAVDLFACLPGKFV